MAQDNPQRTDRGLLGAIVSHFSSEWDRLDAEAREAARVARAAAEAAGEDPPPDIPDEVPVVLDNEAGETASSWVRFVVRHLDSEQETLLRNRPRFRVEATAITQVFTTEDCGVGRAYELAQRAASIFPPGKFVSGDYKADFGAARISEVGQVDQSTFYQLNVESPFVYRERRLLAQG